MILRASTFSPRRLRGEIALPGDKSISHRAVILATASVVPTSIEHLNPGRDLRATIGAVRSLGATIEESGSELRVAGGELRNADGTIDAMNSGSTARMMLGVCTGANLHAHIDGDDSLRRRPMEPVAAHLRALGARIESTQGHLPVRIEGAEANASGHLILVEPSAQIKSALLFAALFAGRPLRISGDRYSRDHTERMLAGMGAGISWNGREIDLYRPQIHGGASLTIPGDISAAAFFIVGATLSPGSALLLRNVNVNPTRTGLLDALQAMGARIELRESREHFGEPVADIFVESARLHATSVDAATSLRAIDELPLLAVAAAFAEGTTKIVGVRELQSKESDRLAAIHRLLNSVAIRAEDIPNGIEIHGGSPKGTDTIVETHDDHRIQMAGAILGCAAGPVRIDSTDGIDVSFPTFLATLESVSR